VVKITICGCREFECPEADIVESFVVNAECLIRIFHKLMNGKGRVVGLKNRA